MAKIKLFIAEHCEPCQAVKNIVQKAKSEDVEMVDVETDEGFPYIQQLGIEGIPSAYKEGEKCELYVDEEAEVINIICRGDRKDLPESSVESEPESP